MQERLKIYQKVLNKRENDKVVVQLVRNQQPMEFEYLIKEFVPEEGQRETPKQQFLLQKIEEDEKIKILKQKYEFAPTLQEIRQKERKNMLDKGRMPQT